MFEYLGEICNAFGRAIHKATVFLCLTIVNKWMLITMCHSCLFSPTLVQVWKVKTLTFHPSHLLLSLTTLWCT